MRQAEEVTTALKKIHTSVTTEIRIVETLGDRRTSVPIEMIPGSGRFTRTLEERLVEGCIDLAVHSAKDLPWKLLEGLTIGAIPAREDPRDALISTGGNGIDKLPQACRIGTGSPRRVAQLLRHRKDLIPVPLRGNLDTRLRRLEYGEMDAIIVGMAGLIRMGWESVVGEIMDPVVMMPAAGQGALIVEARERDEEILELIRPLDHEDSHVTVEAERSVLSYLEAGCGLPIGVLALAEDSTVVLRGTLLSSDGSLFSSAQVSGRKHDGARLGKKLAKRLLRKGGKGIVEAWTKESRE